MEITGNRLKFIKVHLFEFSNKGEFISKCSELNAQGNWSLLWEYLQVTTELNLFYYE